MGRDRPPDFADRLPRVVPKEETDISHLSDEMVDLLYPGRRPRPFRIGMSFSAFEGPGYPKALAAARRSPVYREEPGRDGPRHFAAFEAKDARAARDLFEILRERPDAEVPLFWIFVGGEA